MKIYFPEVLGVFCVYVAVFTESLLRGLQFTRTQKIIITTDFKSITHWYFQISLSKWWFIFHKTAGLKI